MRLFIPFPCWIDSWWRWPQQRQKNKWVFFLCFSQVHIGVCREGVTMGVCSSYTFIPAHLQRCITCWGQVIIIWQNHCSPDYILFSPAPQPPQQASWTREKQNRDNRKSHGLRAELQELVRPSKKHQHPHQSSSCVLRVADSNDHLVWGLHPLWRRVWYALDKAPERRKHLQWHWERLLFQISK